MPAAPDKPRGGPVYRTIRVGTGKSRRTLKVAIVRKTDRRRPTERGTA